MRPSLYHRLLGAVLTVAAAGLLYAHADAQSARPAQPPAAPAQSGSAARPNGGRPPGAPDGQPATEPPGWWHTDSFRKEIGITADESTRLERIWQDAFPRLREQYRQLDEREDKLSRLIEKNADEQVIVAQIDRVEAMRGALNKERQLMLVHMRAVLTPDQRVKFNEHWVRYREQQPPPAQRTSQGTQRTPSGGSRGRRPAPSSATPSTQHPD